MGKNHSKIFVFEGVDHVGKTTIIHQLCERLQTDYDLEVFSVSFPGKETRTLGGLVYEIHHNNHKYFEKPLNNISLQLLHVASHIDNIFSKIIPAIEEGKIILLDRFWWSTFAYGVANGIPKNLLKQIIAPELYCLKKIKINKYFLIKRDKKTIDFTVETYNSICKTYDELYAQSNNSVVIFNNGEIEQTVESILKYIVDGKG